MGKRGPSPSPTVIKKLKGNPGKRPLNQKEPKPKAGIPKAPAWLDQRAKRVFRELGVILDNMKVITEADRRALELTVDAYTEYRQARDFIKKNGHAYQVRKDLKTDDISNEIWYEVTWKVYPHVKISESAWRRVMLGLDRFGLNPSSRAGVQMRSDADKDPMEEFLKSGGRPTLVKK